jgi:hypothetical protein
MSDIDTIRAEIERERKLVSDGTFSPFSGPAAQRLTPVRQLDRPDGLTGERNRLKAARPGPVQGRVLGGRRR